MAAVLMHNIMVEARLQMYEVEDENMYNISDTTTTPESSVQDTNCIAGDDARQSNDDSDRNANLILNYHMWDKSTKFQKVHKGWEELYDFEGSIFLKEAMKCHLYMQKFEDNAITTAGDTIDGYNSLLI